MASKLYIPALGGLYAKFTPSTWLMVRVVAGALLIPHGYQKLFVPGVMDGTTGFLASLGLVPAGFWVWVLALTEFVGGILLVVGFLTRPAAAMVFGLMAVIVIRVHLDNGFFWNKGGFEYPLMWGVISLAILIRGAGDYSVDSKMSRQF